MNTTNILIVEDELVTRNTLKSIFEAEGYKVLEATDGDEMYQILRSHTVNLVIMDINLPGKNGLLLARELRDQHNIALMFLTGRDNEVDKILGLEIGADDYITKPFNPRELTIRARNLLSRSQSAVTVEEKSVLDYNRGNPTGNPATLGQEPPPSVPLAAVYPSDGTLISDNPWLVLDASWVTPAQKAAAAWSQPRTRSDRATVSKWPAASIGRSRR